MGLGALIAQSNLVYQSAEQTFTLKWTLPHWTATYDSASEKVVVVPAGKK